VGGGKKRGRGKLKGGGAGEMSGTLLHKGGATRVMEGVGGGCQWGGSAGGNHLGLAAQKAVAHGADGAAGQKKPIGSDASDS